MIEVSCLGYIGYYGFIPEPAEFKEVDLDDIEESNCIGMAVKEAHNQIPQIEARQGVIYNLIGEVSQVWLILLLDNWSEINVGSREDVVQTRFTRGEATEPKSVGSKFAALPDRLRVALLEISKNRELVRMMAEYNCRLKQVILQIPLMDDIEGFEPEQFLKEFADELAETYSQAVT